MMGDLKPGEKAFKELAAADGIFLCNGCACHYLTMCDKHPDQCAKVTWYNKTKVKP